MTYKGIIANVVPDSIADELRIKPGDRLVSVNGQPLQDIIDLSFALADEYVELLIEKADGQEEAFEIEKDYDEDLGLEFESAVFDRVRQCANKCIFCFVDQMPQGMRESLYIKDDDYRLSFLYGNFVTMTNLGPKDIQRIKQLHLTPLYASVHTTNGELRAKMLNNKRAGNIMEQIKELIEAGVSLHAQIVLCPGVNDGEELDKTISDLYALYPDIMSLAVVPVGLTRYRENCYPLEAFTASQANDVISLVEKWQNKCRAEGDTTFVYLADEFYLAAGHNVPDYETYDDFPQLENGVGIVRNFLAEWEEEVKQLDVGYEQPHYIDLVCGMSAAKVFRPLLDKLNIPGLNVRLVPVENKFFGPHVTVTGLLTGQDIIDQLRTLQGPRTGVIIPGIALRKGQPVFLDETTPENIAAELGTTVRTAYFAKDLLTLLKGWR